MKGFATEVHTLKHGASELRYARIPWDSEYLHNTTIEIEHFSGSSADDLQGLLTQLKKKYGLTKGDLLVSKIPITAFSTIHLFDQVGFYFVEQAISFDVDLSSWNPDAFAFPRYHTYAMLPAQQQDKKRIRDIAGSTFIADRFHVDSNIPKKRADERFSMWIENSFHSSDSIYKFIDNNGAIVGFYIIHQYDTYVDLRLAGLDRHYIGHGLGKLMYHHMYRLLKKQKQTHAKATISLNNAPVLNVYTYLGQIKFSHPLTVLHDVL